MTELVASGRDDDRRRRALAAGLVVALVTSVLWVVIRQTGVPVSSSTPSLDGTILYAVDDGPGWARLWRWDLETNRVRPGPRVREPQELVNAAGAAPGLVGVTSKDADARSTASLLRFLGPNDAPVPLVRGDLISWSGHGVSVVAVKRGPIVGGCRPVVIETRTVIPPLSERQLAERICGDVLSVGRDSNSTYFTRWNGRTADIVLAGYGRIREILPDHALLSLSPASDMLVVPTNALPAIPLAPLAVRAADGPPISEVFGTALYFRGLADPRPYGGANGQLWIDRVLAWSDDSTSALIAGRFQGRNGVFQIATGPGRDLPAPRFVGAIDGGTWATFAADATGIVLTSDVFSVVRDGTSVPLPLPPDAPSPNGPIVWLP